MKKELLNHTVTLTLALDTVAEDFKYKIIADDHDDVYHSGYSSDSIRKLKLNLPKDLEDELSILFPSEVGQALEDAERSAISEAIVKYQMNALEAALLKIDLSEGHAEYTTGDMESISAKAGIKSVSIDTKENTITVEILNPEHLINTMIHGLGRFYPDLSPYEAADSSEMISRFHNLYHYFDIYGEAKPSGELPSQEQGDVSDDYLYDLIKENISNLSLSEVAHAIVDCSHSDRKTVVMLATKYTGFSESEIKEEVRTILQDKQEQMNKEIESWN